MNKIILQVECLVNAPIEKVWNYWTSPNHVMQWNNASDDWHTPKATIDLKVGGRFLAEMAAKDGSFRFEFGGIYKKVIIQKQLEIILDDGRKWEVSFSSSPDGTKVIENFDAESENPIEMQQAGWQAILNNFKKYTEGN